MRSARAVLPFVLFLSFFLSAISAENIEAAEQILRPRPWMGITVRDAGKPVPGDPGTGRKGVVVADVIKGGPAEAAGISASDVITGINGREVYGVADFVTEIQPLGVGEPVVVEVDRDGVVKSVDVVLTRRPAGLFAPRGSYASGMGGATYTGVRPGACDHGDGSMDGGMDGCGGYGGMKGHHGYPGRTGDIWVPGGSNYGRIYYMRMARMLGLDQEQKNKADELESAYRKQSIKLGSQIRIAGIELEEMADADKVDLKKVKAKIDEIASMGAELEFTRYKSLNELRKILTLEQRRRLDKLSLMDDAGHGEYGPGSMGVETYGYGGHGGTKSCDKPGRGGPLIIEVPAQ